MSVNGINFSFILFLAVTSLSKACGQSVTVLFNLEPAQRLGKKFMLATVKLCNGTMKVILTY